MQRRPDANSSSSQQLTAQPLYAVDNETAAGGPEQNQQTTRRQLFVPEQQQQQQSHDEISNYPTLKLEASSNAAASSGEMHTSEQISTATATSALTTTTTTTVHRENEKLQQQAAAATMTSIQVHPGGLERTEQPEQPPIVNKRTKHLKNAADNHVDATPLNHSAAGKEKTEQADVAENSQMPLPPPAPFQRAGSRNESGIRRDAAGIPQEIPDQMFAAAMTARGNRKSQANLIESVPADGPSNDAVVVAGSNVVSVSVGEEERTRSAKRPSRPPARGDSLNSITSSATVIELSTATVSDDEVVGSDVTTIDVECDVSQKASKVAEDLSALALSSKHDGANVEGKFESD